MKRYIIYKFVAVVLSAIIYASCGDDKYPADVIADTFPIVSIKVSAQNGSFQYGNLTLNVPSSASTQSINVRSLGDWWSDYGYSSSWFRLSPDYGSNNSTITLTIDENTLPQKRSGNITIYNIEHGNRVTIVVDQEAKPYSLTLSKSNISFDSDAGSSNFFVNSNDSWTVQKDAYWITLSETSGNSNGYIEVNVARNTSSSSRTGTITVTGKNSFISRRISIYQEGQEGTNETFKVNGVSFNMIFVKGGTFQMGSTSEQGHSYSLPVHNVTLSSYSIGETEVTQALWKAVMGSNPSCYTGDEERPVECVSWYYCQDFVKELNRLTGKNFRLPTEAEWEYAARGGSKSKGYKYSGSDNFDDVAWVEENSGSTTHHVKTKQANELGIYDMSGNVNEVVYDWFSNYSISSQINPTGPSSGTEKIQRGGGYYWSSGSSCVCNRQGIDPTRGYRNVGFRIAL